MQHAPASLDPQPTPSHQLETYAQVAKRIGLCRSTLYAMRKPGDGRYDPTFPEPIPVGPPSNPYAAVRFIAAEVDVWVESRKRLRQSGSDTAAPHHYDRAAWAAHSYPARSLKIGPP